MKVLGVLYIAVSALVLLGALFLMLVFGGAAGIVGAAADPSDAAVAIPILGIAGTALVALLLCWPCRGSSPAGACSSSSPGRVSWPSSCRLNLINFPFGTVLGIYGLWVLLNKETERLFSAPQ